MRADEIRNDLRLFLAGLFRRTVKLLLELVEELEGRLAHDSQHVVARVLGRDLEPAGNVMLGQFFDVALMARFRLGRHALVVKKKIIADAAGNEGVIHALRLANRFVDIEQRGMVGVEIAADVGPDAAGADALVADPLLLALHLVHVGGRAAEIADRPAIIGHLLDRLHLAQNAFLAAAGDKLSLVRRDRAEAAAAKAPAVHVDRVLDHLVGRNRAAACGTSDVADGCKADQRGETRIDLALAHRGERRIHHEQTVAEWAGTAGAPSPGLTRSRCP